MSEFAAVATSRLGELVGAEHVVADAAALAAYEVDGLRPRVALRPGSAGEIAEILQFAVVERLAVIPMGGRTKLGIGMPPRNYDLALDVSRLNHVLAFDARDLTLGVEPGVRFADLARHLAAEGQFLPLAPPFAENATLGGMAAANADTPLRCGFGGMRDHLLGMEFVTGAGTPAKSGGRVVKNVSGYDIHKLLIGSLGTLAVITRLNFRTFPVAPMEKIFVAAFPDAGAALDLCGAIGASQLQPRVLDALSPVAAKLVINDGEPWWRVVISAAGHSTAIERHGRDLEVMARNARATEFCALGEGQRGPFFARLCDVPRLLPELSPATAIFRIAALPTAMPALLESLREITQRHALEHAALVRAAGIVYAALLPAAGDDAAVGRLPGACAELMRAAIASGAQPMIERCPQEVKLAMSVWPAAGPEQGIAERLKKVFDPHGILAPGRFRGGI